MTTLLNFLTVADTKLPLNQPESAPTAEEMHLWASLMGVITPESEVVAVPADDAKNYKRLGISTMVKSCTNAGIREFKSALAGSFTVAIMSHENLTMLVNAETFQYLCMIDHEQKVLYV